MLNASLDLAFLQNMCNGSMVEHLGIIFTGIGKDYLTAKMPVDHRTHQPFGILHGGASVALAETLGSVAANLEIDQKSQYCVGMEINANHIKSVHEGWVYGTTKPIHIGKKTHIWEVKINNSNDQLVCISRITLAVIGRKDNDGMFE